MTPAEFIAAFPAFENEDSAVVQRHIDLAVLLLDLDRWGPLYPQGMGLLVAHSIVTERAEAAAIAGAMSGGTTNPWLPIKSKTNDTVSITWADRPADWLLRSTYGERYRALVRLVGFGAVAV